MLTNELLTAQRELAAAQSFFDNAPPGREDEAIFMVCAAEERMNNFFRMAKKEAGGEGCGFLAAEDGESEENPRLR